MVRRRQQERHKFACLTMKNNSFARFARAFSILDISQTFSFFRHKFAYLTMKNNSFARFARAFSILDISQTFSFFRHKFAYLTMKTIVLHALHVHFQFWTFRRRSRSFHDVKSPVLQMRGRRDHAMKNVQFCPISEALVPI